MTRKLLSLLLCAALILSGLPLTAVLPVAVLAAGDTGAFTITGGTLDEDYSFSGTSGIDGVLTINSGAALTISTNGQISDRIVIGENVNANLTLNGVNINAPENTSAIDVPNTSSLTLTLADNSNNTLTVSTKTTTSNTDAANNAGIHVPASASLTIQCDDAGDNHECNDSCGALSVTGGEVTAVNGRGGAGIGGASGDGATDSGETSGTVIINGGRVAITGGAGSFAGPGIGGGAGTPGGDCGAVYITGGQIEITGGQGNGYDTTYGGAGIGGGNCPFGTGGDGGIVVITGGDVQVTGGNCGSNNIGRGGAGIGGGNGIAVSSIGDGGDGGDGGTVVILAPGVTVTGGSGNAANGTDIGGGTAGNGGSSGDDGQGIQPSSSGSNTYTVYGDLTLPTDVTTYTIPEGVTVNVPAGTSLTVPAGVNLVVNGTLNVEGSLTNNGTISGDGTLKGTGTLTGNGTVTVSTNTFADHSITVTVEGGSGNTATASPTSAKQGDTITLTAAPATGYHFKEWQVTPGSVTISNDNSFTMPANDVKVKAIFEAHTYNQEVVSDTYKKSDATCTEAATYFKSCSCGAKGTETFTDGEALGHTGGTATCTSKAVCTRCTTEYGEVNPNNHTGQPTWVQTTTTHKQEYSCCNAVVIAEESHEWVNGTCTECGYGCNHTGGTATCTTQAVCTICNSQYGELNPNNHNPASEWTQASDKHYHICQNGCGTHLDEKECSGGTATCISKAICSTCEHEYGELGAHDLTENSAKDPSCTESGNSLYWECFVCNKLFSDAQGNTETQMADVTIAATGHTMQRTEEVDATCTTPGKEAYYTCSVCEKHFSDEGGRNEISNLEEYGIIPATGHTAGTEWKHDGNTHWNECKDCGTKMNEAAHVYDGGQDATCDVCGYERNTYTLTVDLAGGNGSVTGGIYAEGAVVQIDAGTRTNYRFAGWTSSNGGSFANASSASTIFTMPAAETTITARWEYNAYPIFPPTPSEPDDDGPTTDGSAGWSDIQTELGSASDGDTITVEMNGTTEVPAEIFETIAGQDITVSFEMEGGVSWQVNGTDIPAGTSLHDLNLGVDMNTNGISANVINAITGEISTVQITLAYDGEFGFTMTLSAPLGEEHHGYWANLYYFDEAAQRLIYQTASLIDENGHAHMRMSHASQYAIVIDDYDHGGGLPFVDVSASDWYYDAVAYVFDAGIMGGTSATTFEPQTATTRAMIVSMLHRLEGVPNAEASNFTDVSAGDWYAEPVAWAASVGVVGGYDDGTFQPNKSITREELASILYRYAQYKGYDVSARADLSRYTDAPSPWAYDVMAWANAEGLITGRTATTIDAQATLTRAECAAIFQRFIG